MGNEDGRMSTDGKIRAGVVGVGHFGRYHAQKYAQAAGAELVAVSDADAARAGDVAAAHGARAEIDYRALIGQVDAVSIAVPTSRHYEVARAFLEAGVHVLIEKPITSSVEEADALIALARARGLVLQVGHLVRFFAKDTGLIDRVSQPLYIEATRITPYSPRVTDVSVVLDLMIHDIDLIMVLAQSPVARVEAVGAPVLSPSEDIVNARLTFESGCVANITTSRVAFKSERKMRIFQHDRMFNVDSLAGHVDEIERPDGAVETLGPDLESSGLRVTRRSLDGFDALEAEINAFLTAIGRADEPVVTGEDGRAALDVAERIHAAVARQAEMAGQGAAGKGEPA